MEQLNITSTKDNDKVYKILGDLMNAGKELWSYYHTKADANPNASLYDIKEYFQGRNENGKMNASSSDPFYTELLDNLKFSLRALGEEIKPKVYEYGFLK